MSRGGTLHRFCAVRNNLVNVNDEDRGSLRELARYLVGPAEISALLNVEANTVNVWKVRHAEFPQTREASALRGICGMFARSQRGPPLPAGRRRNPSSTMPYGGAPSQ